MSFPGQLNQAFQAAGGTSLERRRRAFILNGLLLACSSWRTAFASASAPTGIVLGTTNDEKSYYGYLLRRIYVEAFRRLGIPLEIVVAPLKRLSLMLEQGKIDGELARAPAYGKEHPDLIAIETAVATAVFSIYAINPIAGLSKLEDLGTGNFRAVYRRGVVLCERTLSGLLPASRITAVATAAQSAAMLGQGHADFYCDINSSLLNEEYAGELQHVPEMQKLFDISEPVPLNGYLQAKHKALAAKLASTLKHMENEGLLEKYRLDARKYMKKQTLRSSQP